MSRSRWICALVLPGLFSVGFLLSSCEDASDSEVQRLRAMLSQGQQAEVQAAAKKLSMDPPRTVAARLPLARLLIDVDLARLAVAILKEERLDAAARDVLALAYLRNGDRVRARALVDEQIVAGSDSALTHRVLGEVHLMDLLPRESRTALNESLLRDADDPVTSVLLAATHLQEEDAATAERILRDAHRRFPDHPVVSGALAEVVLSTRPREPGPLGEVVRLLRQASERLPLKEGYRERLSVALMSLGDHKEAKVVLEALTKQWPENPRHWNRLGLVRRELGDLPGAVEAFDRSVKCGNDESRASLKIYLNLGSAQLEMADLTEEREKWGQAAWRTFEAVQKIAPNNALVFKGLAKATVEMDPTGERVRAAIQMYEKALELTKLASYAPEEVHEMHLNVALLYFDLWIQDREVETEGRRKALQHFREAEKLVPTARWHQSAVITYEELKPK